MFKRRWTAGLLLSAALLLTNGAGATPPLAQSRPEFTEEFHQSYALSGEGTVSLSNINGDVRVNAWDRNEVKVDAVKSARTREDLQEVTINVEAGGHSVNVETRYPENRWSDREVERRGNSTKVQYTLSVPRSARLEQISLVNGTLNIEGVAGPVRASVVNGLVQARGLTGPVNISVVNAPLEASLDRLNDSSTVNLSAVNGPLTVTLPSDSSATVRASTVHGPITNDFNLPVREGEYVGRNLEGRLGPGGARVRLSNVNGAIRIKRANDNRPLSPATNLLSETRAREDFDGDRDDAREAQRDALRDARERERESARERREMERDVEEAAREIERETARAAKDIDKEMSKIDREMSKIDKEMSRIDKERIKEDAKRSVAGRDTSARQTERESKTLAVSGAPRVRVETFDGSVFVRAWDKQEVMYTATKRATDEREIRGIKLLTQGEGGGEVTLRAEFDKSAAPVYEERGGRVVSFVSNASVDYDVYVPRNSALYVSTGDGRVRVEGVSGEVEIQTGDGNIDVTGARGRLRAQTGDGGIRVHDFEGEADARTGDGRITLDGNFRSLSARTGDGGISLTLPEGVNATVETNSESVFNDGIAVAETPGESRVRRWRVGGGGQLFTLRTGDGQIVLRRR